MTTWRPKAGQGGPMWGKAGQNSHLTTQDDPLEALGGSRWPLGGPKWVLAAPCPLAGQGDLRRGNAGQDDPRRVLASPREVKAAQSGARRPNASHGESRWVKAASMRQGSPTHVTASQGGQRQVKAAQCKSRWPLSGPKRVKVAPRRVKATPRPVKVGYGRPRQVKVGHGGLSWRPKLDKTGQGGPKRVNAGEGGPKAVQGNPRRFKVALYGVNAAQGWPRRVKTATWRVKTATWRVKAGQAAQGDLMRVKAGQGHGGPLTGQGGLQRVKAGKGGPTRVKAYQGLSRWPKEGHDDHLAALSGSRRVKAAQCESRRAHCSPKLDKAGRLKRPKACKGSLLEGPEGPLAGQDDRQGGPMWGKAGQNGHLTTQDDPLEALGGSRWNLSGPKWVLAAPWWVKAAPLCP
ncbi:hypothetical protein ACLB2K_061526 [Fragaria x ananassa]